MSFRPDLLINLIRNKKQITQKIHCIRAKLLFFFLNGTRRQKRFCWHNIWQRPKFYIFQTIIHPRQNTENFTTSKLNKMIKKERIYYSENYLYAITFLAHMKSKLINYGKILRVLKTCFNLN